MTEFTDGARVRVEPHFWWPHGALGIVRPFPGVLDEIPDIAAVGGLCVDRGGCTRPYLDSDGSRTMVWVVFDRPALDCDGDGPYQQGEVLSHHLQLVGGVCFEADFAYRTDQIVALPDGRLVIGCTAFGMPCGELVDTDAPDVGFWRWLAANTVRFPEVNLANVAAVRLAYAARNG